MENESAKVPVLDSPPIPGNLAYVIAKKPRKNQNSTIDTAFSDFLWCIKVRSKDVTLPNITGILIEPAKIVATDGHGLHLITNPYPSIPPGEYDVYAINQSKVILIAKLVNPATSFPKWNQPSVTMEGITPEYEIAVDHPIYFYIEILKHRMCDIKLLESAISNEPMNVRIYSKQQPVIITTPTRTAIVMPLLDRK